MAQSRISKAKGSLCANKLCSSGWNLCSAIYINCWYVDKHLVGGQFYYLHQRHEYSDVDGERAVKVVQLKRKMHFLAG
jgi:hypothetical protein